jgi:hypothetical protein
MRRAAESSCRAKATLLRAFAMSASRCCVAALGFSAEALSKSGVRMTRCLSHAETDSMPALISRSSRVVRMSAADRIGIPAAPGVSTNSSLAAGTAGSLTVGRALREMRAGREVRTDAVLRAERNTQRARRARSAQITRAEANAAYEDLLQLDLELFPFQPFAQRIWGCATT